MEEIAGINDYSRETARRYVIEGLKNWKNCSIMVYKHLGNGLHYRINRKKLKSIKYEVLVWLHRQQSPLEEPK